jgi:hypothetical protein
MKQLQALVNWGPTVVPLDGRGVSTFYLSRSRVKASKGTQWESYRTICLRSRDKEFWGLYNTYTHEGTKTD